MKSHFNRILLIVLFNGRKITYSVPGDKKPEILFAEIIKIEGIKRSDIKTNFFFPNTLYEISHYQNFFDVEKKEMDELGIAVHYKIEEFKKQRSHFFNILDLEFMKSLEEDNKKWTAHITKIKNYLRDAPTLIEEYCRNIFPKDIMKFNAFNNIFDIRIINGGSGYTTPPKVTIGSPSMIGLPVKAIATIKDGKVHEIIITQVGSGYLTKPNVVIDPPGNEGEVAIAISHESENDIYT